MRDAPRIRTIVGDRTLPWAQALDVARAEDEAWTRRVQPIEPVDLLAWLRTQSGDARVYWAPREGGVRIAGAGLAFAQTGDAFDLLDDLPRDDGSAPDAPMSVHVACRFDLDADPDASWAAYAPVAAWIPAVSIHERDGRQWLCTLRAPPPAVGAATADAGASPSETARGAWREGVAEVLQRIADHRLQKGVFTRRVVHPTPTPIDPLRLLESLDASPAPAYRFLVQPHADTAFVGLTPERLYRRRGLQIESEALAGTTPRGSTPDADTVLGDALLRSPKDRLEHDLVRRHIRTRLAPFTTELHCDEEPHLERLEHVQHLRSHVLGRLVEDARDADLLGALHPTPAVCGLPTVEALDVLRAHEGFDRGWYAGLVGTWRPDEAEFAVAIRCALVRAHQIDLFAGAGIVEGSDADAEWDETVEKLRTIGDVIARGVPHES